MAVQTLPPSDAQPASQSAAAPSGSAGDAETFLVGHEGHSVRRALDKQIQGAPRVVLRSDAEGAEPPVRSQSGEMPPGQKQSRYQLHGEIARGAAK
jgi:hypothetical protein